MMLLDKRYNQQAIIDDYRQSFQENQSWFESMIKALESLEIGSGLSIDKRLQKIEEIANEFAENENRIDIIREKADSVMREVGDMDRQHVQVGFPELCLQQFLK
jgi:uncharacterized membrane protein